MRSSGQSPMPALTAAGTEPRRSSLTVDADGARGRTPGSVEGLEDLRAARADEAGQPDDLPRPHREVDAGEDARQRETAHVQHGSVSRETAAPRCGKTYSIARPVISWISSEVGVSPTASPLATVLPSLSTVIRSPIWRISSRRWEM